MGLRLSNTQTQPKLLTMDILVLATMKNAAKCDTQCELQNSVNHQNFERILRSEVFLRACLSQWHLPLSPCGFFCGTLVRAAGLRAVRAVSSEHGCVAPRAELARLGTTATVCAQRSVVVGCLDCASLPIAVAVVHDWQVSAVILAVFPARSHGCLWSSLAVLFGVWLSVLL